VCACLCVFIDITTHAYRHTLCIYPQSYILTHTHTHIHIQTNQQMGIQMLACIHTCIYWLKCLRVPCAWPCACEYACAVAHGYARVDMRVRVGRGGRGPGDATQAPASHGVKRICHGARFYLSSESTSTLQSSHVTFTRAARVHCPHHIPPTTLVSATSPTHELLLKQVFYTWVARSCSGSFSFTALAPG
jgi:hypothetical protein